MATASAKTASIPDDHIFIFEKVPAQHGGKTYQPWADVFLTGTKEYTPKPTVGDNRKTLAFLVYSSGTTGLPKGVMLSHHNIIANLLQINMADGHFTKPTDVHLGFLPFYHIYGLTLILQTGIWCNTPTVVMPRFDMEQFLTLVQRYRVTLVNLVPPVALGLAKHPLVDKFDLSSIHYTNSGAAPLGAEIVEAVYKRTGVLVKQGYGLSETSPTTVAQPRYPGGWNELKEHMGSIGYLKSNLEAKVIDLEGKDLGYDQPGELCFRGPNIMMASTLTCCLFPSNFVGLPQQQESYRRLNRQGWLVLHRRRSRRQKGKGWLRSLLHCRPCQRAHQVQGVGFLNGHTVQTLTVAASKSLQLSLKTSSVLTTTSPTLASLQSMTIPKLQNSHVPM